MSGIGQSFNSWLQHQNNVSVMRQEATICDYIPPNTKEQMIDISERSAKIRREKGAPITQDYTLGKERTGLEYKVPIPRPEGTIGTYHTHPHGWPSPSPHDVLDIMDKSDKVACIGATGKIGTKIQCFTPGDSKWTKMKADFDKLNAEILRHNEKVWKRYKKKGSELLMVIKSDIPTRPELYDEYLSIMERRRAFISRLDKELYWLRLYEWQRPDVIKIDYATGMAVKEDGFEYETLPTLLSKCRVHWETLEEELPAEL